MKAVIYETTGAIGAGAVEIAGRPLLIRQLQWLRDLGIDEVVVEVALGVTASERGALLLGSDPLSARCIVIPTRYAIGVAALAQRAGLGDDELFVALASDTLVHGALLLDEQPTCYRLPAPAFAALPSPVEIALRTRVAEPSAETPVDADLAWGLRVVDLATAHSLSCAALTGQAKGLLVHAAELKPGIWLARGARVAEEATLLAPVLIGADARVFGNARLGPNVLVGRHSVIEREVVLSEAQVAPNTLVGEGMRVRQAQVDARGITSFAEQARTEIDEPLQLAHAIDRGPLWTSRLFALALGLVLLLPWTLGLIARAVLGKRVVRRVRWRGRDLHVGTIGWSLLDLLPALYDVLLGRRDLVGVAAEKALELEGGRSDGPARGGALDISWALAPRTSTSTLLWMWRWYLQNKSARLDRSLFWEQRRSIGEATRAQKKRSA